MFAVLFVFAVLAAPLFACRGMDEDHTFLISGGMLHTVAFWRVIHKRMDDHFRHGYQFSGRPPIEVPTEDPWEVSALSFDGSATGSVHREWADRLGADLAACDAREKCDDFIRKNLFEFMNCVQWEESMQPGKMTLAVIRYPCSLPRDVYLSARAYYDEAVKEGVDATTPDLGEE